MLAMFKTWMELINTQLNRKKEWTQHQQYTWTRITVSLSHLSSIAQLETWTWSRRTNYLTSPRIQILIPFLTILRAILTQLALFKTIQKRQQTTPPLGEALKIQGFWTRSTTWLEQAMVQSKLWMDRARIRPLKDMLAKIILTSPF
jgi:hypothetical protein